MYSHTKSLILPTVLVEEKSSLASLSWVMININEKIEWAIIQWFDKQTFKYFRIKYHLGKQQNMIKNLKTLFNKLPERM